MKKFTQDGITYKLYKNNTAKVYKADKSVVNVEIPRTLNVDNVEYKITSVFSESFWNCKSLTNITLPDSIKSIGNYAFWNCISLTDVILPDSIESIGSCAFYDCTNLKNVTLSNSIKSHGFYVFYGCTKLDKKFVRKWDKKN